MSPHVEVSTALLALDHPDSTVFAEALVEKLIVCHFTSGTFTAEEYHHYSAWLLKASRKRLAQMDRTATILS